MARTKRVFRWSEAYSKAKDAAREAPEHTALCCAVNLDIRPSTCLRTKRCETSRHASQR